MRALLPLLSLSLCLSIASSPAFADDNGHKDRKERARSHEEAGARDSGNARSAKARAERARAEAARAHNAHSERAKAERAKAERARTERARAEAARRDAARRHAARHHVARHRPAPPPSRRVVVTNAPPPRKRSAAPAIFADRTGQFSLGLSAGSLVSGYESGTSFGDLGMGVVGSYRVAPGLALEASLSQFRDDGGERVSTPLSMGVQALAFPTSRVNPYVSAGVSFTGRNFDDTFCDGEEYVDFVTRDTLFGPYGGLGVELALAPNATLDLEGRLNTAMNLGVDDPTVPVSFQGLVGMNFYF
jgi:opacity protein-like surface antigen